MLAEVLIQLVVVVGILLPISLALFVGRERLVRTRSEWRTRLKTAAPTIAVLLVVLLINRFARQRAPRLSREIGFHLTASFYNIEGEFILLFQSIATPETTAYFSSIYVYGYVFLIVFPVLAYFTLPDTRMFRRLLTAYALNYVIGLVLYIFVIAYGPRNVMPHEVAETMLFENKPQVQYLTREVNSNTNVFPSLHTSLSATVATFAAITRSTFPKWFPVAVALAASVAISTMFLGIHWGIDVVAGMLLAALCVVLSDRLVGRWSVSELLGDRLEQFEDRIPWQE
ncbi:phosphatase PAP2 family protein [Natrinema altunense]|uniref:Phosphoesterase PA-phosphatase-related protein n=1 Tax=Natrinema altunense (strain JCM 12890 / CGMCC 1.3731 / AJ2) TaxID=1227494 RepID=L9ZT81_NATA2|nr:phosphatase PAP2 family protein [Natrinema altunense]ELY89670.1 phosphoesterase PA-phosphatase-related protein [Natrinema altunense JCM 12890]